MKAFQKIFKTSIFAALVLAATSCTDKIDLDIPDGDTYIVFEGFITNIDRPHNVIISYTSPYFDDAPQPKATGASVILRDNESNEITLTETSPGVYTFDGPGEIGKAYQLDVLLASGEQYMSTFETLATEVPIDNIYWQLSEDEPDEDDDQSPTDIYEVLIETAEPVGVGDYYRWRAYKNSVEYKDPEDIFVASDEFVDGNPIDEFNVTDDLYSIGDTVLIVQEHIQRSQFEFMNLLISQTAAVGSPFDNPPAPVIGNMMKVGDPDALVLGYFGTAAQTFAEIVVGE